eukprot:m.379376 g.379376  ORF g.379376 m.379376 type:complete len:1913 (-) comp20030_c0_seq3:258-5996(-)
MAAVSGGQGHVPPSGNNGGGNGGGSERAERNKTSSGGRTLSARFRAFLGLGSKAQGGASRVRYKDLPQELVAGVEGHHSLPHRVGCLHRLCDLLDTMWVEAAIGEALWLAVRDLLQSDQMPATRQQCLLFLSKLLHALAESSTMFRVHVFQVLSSYDTVTEDFVRLLDALDALMQSGSNILGFEIHVVPFLLELLPVSLQLGQSSRINQLCSEIFRLNPGLVGTGAANDLVFQLCRACNDPVTRLDVGSAMLVLGSLALSPAFPAQCLPDVLRALCRVVCLHDFANTALGVVENAVNANSHLLQLTVMRLCAFIEQDDETEDPTGANRRRGAVFLLTHMGWGDMKVSHREAFPLDTVLACFGATAQTCSAQVLCEMALSIHVLVKKRARELSAFQWEHICDIAWAVQELGIEQSDVVLQTVSDMLTVMEQLFSRDEFDGDAERLFTLVERQPGDRDLAQALEYKRKSLHPSTVGWLSNVEELLSSYFQGSKQVPVKLKALSMLEDVFSSTRYVYDQELVQLLLRHLNNLFQEDFSVQKAALELVAKLASAYDGQAEHLFQFIKTYLDRISSLPQAAAAVRPRAENCAAAALCRIFRARVAGDEPRLCLRAYTEMLRIVQDHARESKVTVLSEYAVDTINTILSALVDIRWDARRRVYLDGSTTASPSPFVLVSSNRPRRASVSSNTPVAEETTIRGSRLLALYPMFNVFLLVLRSAKCPWSSKGIVIGGLEALLRLAPSVIVTGDLCLDELCHNLLLTAVSCTETKTAPKGFQDFTPQQKAQIMQLLYSSLAAMTLYRRVLTRKTQEMIVDCCTASLRQNVSSAIFLLGVCAVELEAKLARLLPGVLQTLQLFKTQRRVKLPLLEFLSLVGHRPDTVKRFNKSDFKLVFAITLESATNENSSAYIRVLAFHLLGLWFLRVPLRDRPALASYLIDGLAAGLATATKAASTASTPAGGGSRDRSGTLTAASPGGAGTSSGGAPAGPSGVSGAGGSGSAAWASELAPLVETYTDFLSRYTYTNPTSALCQPFVPTVPGEGSVQGLQTRSWVQGYTIISISAAPSGWAEIVVRRPTGTVSWVQHMSTRHHFGEDGGGLGLSTILNAQRSEDVADELLQLVDTTLQLPTVDEQADADRLSLTSGLSVSSGTSPPSFDGTGISRPIDIPSLRPRAGASANAASSALSRLSPFSSEPGMFVAAAKSSAGADGAASASGGSTGMVGNHPTPPRAQARRISEDVSNFMPLPVPYAGADVVPSIESSLSDEGDVRRQAWETSKKRDGASQSDQSAEGHGEVRSTQRDATSGSTVKKAGVTRRRATSTDSMSYLGGDEDTDDQAASPSPAASAMAMSSSRPGATVTRPATSEAEEHQQASKAASVVASVTDSPAPSTVGFAPSDVGHGPGGGLAESASSTKKRSTGEGGVPFESSDLRPGALERPALSLGDGDTALLSRSEPRQAQFTSRFKSEGAKAEPASTSKSVQFATDTPTLRVGFDAAERDGRRRVNSLDPKKVSRPRRHTASSGVRSSKHSSLGRASSMDGDKGATEKTRQPSTAAPTEAEETVPQSQTSNQARPRSFTVAGDRQRPSASTSVFDHSKAEPEQLDDAARFLFLQLCSPPYFEAEAIPLTSSNPSDLQRAVRMLDAMAVFETHKIGVVYVGPGQRTGPQILSNVHGSARYAAFLQSLGSFAPLKNNRHYTGGLDTESDGDGTFTIAWSDALTQVVFHVATLMPTLDHDPQCINKKLHIGNDHVTIVFNDSGEPFERSSLAGAVNYVFIVLKPQDDEHFSVDFDVKEGMTQIVSRMDSQVLSNEQIGAHVRQLAIHSNLASLVERNTPRHWQDRLQQIKKIKDRYGGNSVVSGVATRSASAGSSTSSLAGVAGPSTPAGTSSLSRTSVPTSPPAGHHPASRPWNFTSFV